MAHAHGAWVYETRDGRPSVRVRATGGRQVLDPGVFLDMPRASGSRPTPGGIDASLRVPCWAVMMLGPWGVLVMLALLPCLGAALGALGCGAGLGASAAQGAPQHALGDRSDQRVAANLPQAGSASMFTSVHRTRPFGPHNATPPQRVADSAGAAPRQRALST